MCGASGAQTFESSVNGLPIYLDNFAIKALAKGDVSLRQRFVATLHNGADLLFSIANGVEISGAQGASSLAIKTFLDELGPHWYPIDFNPHMVMEQEKAGLDPGRCCFAETLLRAYFVNRVFEQGRRMVFRSRIGHIGLVKVSPSCLPGRGVAVSARLEGRASSSKEEVRSRCNSDAETTKDLARSNGRAIRDG